MMFLIGRLWRRQRPSGAIDILRHRVPPLLFVAPGFLVEAVKLLGGLLEGDALGLGRAVSVDLSAARFNGINALCEELALLPRPLAGFVKTEGMERP